MDDAARQRFDAILESTIECLPPALLDLLEEVPLVVDDQPTPELIASLLAEWGEPDTSDVRDELASTLCGLHTGHMLTERSVEHSAELPESISIFRAGITDIAGGPDADDDTLADQIEITILHEIGHHFGLDEDDLERLGYA